MTPGYYWVRCEHNVDWEPAQWDGARWHWIGDDEAAIPASIGEPLSAPKLMRPAMALVPIEPTAKMVEAAFFDYIGYERKGPSKPAWNARTMWSTMLRTWADQAAKEAAKIPADQKQ